MGKLHYFTALLLIILLAIASGWIFESLEKSPILKQEIFRHDPDYFLENFVATMMDKKGSPAYQVKASFLEHFPDNDNMKLQQPIFSFYENDVKAWIAQANEALIVQKGAKIFLSDNVILQQLTTIDKIPMQLTAKQLTIEPEQRYASTESEVKLTKGNSQIQAVGMRADMNKNRIEFLSRTRSRYVLPAK